MFKKIFISFLLIITYSNLFAMKSESKLLETNQQLTHSTFDSMPDEITELILMESLKGSIDNLPLPISYNNFLEESNNLTEGLAFVQHFSYILQNVRRINHKCNNIILSSEFYARYLLILKLNKLTPDQKFNALLCFIKLRRSTFIAAALLSFLDLTNLTFKEISLKYTLLKNAFNQQIISCKTFKADTLNNYLLKIPNYAKIDQKLLALLIEIRSKIPMFNDPVHYFMSKSGSQTNFDNLSSLEKEYNRYIRQNLQPHKEYYIKYPLDLLNINALFYFHLETYPKTINHYAIPHLKELTKIDPSYDSTNFPTPLMMATFNNNVKSVISLIEKGSDKYLKLHGMTSIHWALLGNSKEVLDYLVPNEEIKDTDWMWFKSLWNWAIRNCSKSILEYFLEKLRANLSSYEFHQVITHKINLVRADIWEEPITCFDEEKVLFLINCDVPLNKFSFTNFVRTESIMINTLFSQRNNINSVAQNLDRLKLSNQMDKVTAEDIIYVCNQTENEARLRNIPIPQNSVNGAAFIAPAPHNIPSSINQNNSNTIVSTKAKKTHNSRRLLCIAGCAILGVVCYKIFNEKNISTRPIINPNLKR